LTDLVWHDFLAIGVKFIDDDHKKLLSIMQKVKRSIEQNDLKQCVPMLALLPEEAVDHFSQEEQFLREVKYPDLASHIEYHKQLLIKAGTVKRICEGPESENNLKVCFDRMANFLIDDILKGDTMFKSYLDHEGYSDKK
jgi:hemerythrin-like metal-binding protein